MNCTQPPSSSPTALLTVTVLTILVFTHVHIIRWHGRTDAASATITEESTVALIFKIVVFVTGLYANGTRTAVAI